MKYIMQGTSALAVMLLLTMPTLAGDATQPIAPPVVTIPAPGAEQPATLKDPVESLNNAIKLYQTGKYSESLTEIDNAKKSVGAKHLAAFQALLPPAPGAGWSFTDKPDTVLMSGVSREYTANGQTVTISYTVDKGLVSLSESAAKMLSALTSSSSADEKSFTIAGYKADYQEVKLADRILLYKLTVHVGDVLVTIQSPTIGKDTLVKFAGLVDFQKLKSLN